MQESILNNPLNFQNLVCHFESLHFKHKIYFTKHFEELKNQYDGLKNIKKMKNYLMEKQKNIFNGNGSKSESKYEIYE